MKHTTLCYLEKDGAYLMLHRVKKVNDENHDKWIGVGGKLEFGESPFDCVRREVFEETGLTVGELHYRGLVTFVLGEYATEYMHVFVCRDFHGEMVKECDEGDLEWVKIEDVPRLPIWEGDKLFLSILPQNKPFFSMKLVYDGDGVLLESVTDYASY